MKLEMITFGEVEPGCKRHPKPAVICRIVDLA